MRHVFIVNPHAGKRNQAARIYEMADRLREKHGLSCECLLTDRAGGAETMARKLAESGDRVRMYACGGDGTAHEVANGIAGFPNAAMTVIPIGTGNDFLKNFGPDLEKFSDAENLWDGDEISLDLIDCNGRQCVTIACNGVDAEVAEGVHDYNHIPALSGRGSYLASIVVNVLLRKLGHRWEVTVDGKKLEGEFLIVSLCNGRYYGGGSMPVPEARMDDGVLHAVVIRKLGKLTFAKLFRTYSDGNYKDLPVDLISVVPAKEVRIRSEEEIVTCLDGECSRGREVVLKLSEKRLNFFGPKGCSPNATAR